MKSCLVQVVTPANQWYGLGNGQSGPSTMLAAEGQTSCTVTLDDQGIVRITKANAFTAALYADGGSVLISAGTGLQTGIYRGVRETDSVLRLDVHKSKILGNRWMVTTTANAANNDTFQLGGTTYTFKTVTAAAGDIFIGASALATMTSLVAALGLTGVAAGAGADYFTGTLGAPLFKSGGIRSLGGGNAEFFVDQRENDWPNVAAPTIPVGTWGTIVGPIDNSIPPAAGQPARTICTDASIRFFTNKMDLWSSVDRPRKLSVVAFSGTTPTIQLFNPRYISVAGASSGPVNGQNDPLLAAPTFALPAGIAIDLADFPAKYGGLLFRIAGANAVVLLNYD